MTWTNGEVTVGDMPFGQWVFEEHLPVSAPETVCPLTSVRFSATDAHMRYVWRSGGVGWSMGVCEVNGYRVLVSGELGREFSEEYDNDDAPGWLVRLAVSRIQLIPKPPES